ncbi:multidrug efflux SMR transporter [Pantoea sp. BAV 3049]|uniref:DMT family transporter n=1 Tax=Pantoea sp. BAV 3049 TaxID=2654188 RepID=UPI00131DFDAC|nr:SMR family transporter [Pantoea sp. BAV 3049]
MSITLAGFLWLFLAIVLEVVATSLLPKTNDFRRVGMTLGVIVLYFFCFLSLSKAMVVLSIGLTYALWCGLGIVLISLVGVMIFRQKMDKYGMLGIALIVAGCVIMGLYK